MPSHSDTRPGALAGCVALITGAAQGIGAATAVLFEAEGAIVVLADRVFAAGLIADGPARLRIGLDVQDEVQWRGVMSALQDAVGRLDILVNNAGILRMAAIEHETQDDFLQVVRVNQLGVFLGMRAVLPLLREAGGGSIVNLSSAAGLTGVPGSISYGATKWAVRGMTKIAAREFAPFGIRVNSVHPGIVATPMIAGFANAQGEAANVPLGRIAAADDVARMVLFAASCASAHSTGCEFICDGGMTLA